MPAQSVGRLENAVGWYHSHPGYGCWLSGIDVGTQARFCSRAFPSACIIVVRCTWRSMRGLDTGFVVAFEPFYSYRAQMVQQQYSEPFLAIVVDPHRTVAAGKVEIGAFRTFPEVWSSSCAQHWQSESGLLQLCYGTTGNNVHVCLKYNFGGATRPGCSSHICVMRSNQLAADAPCCGAQGYKPPDAPASEYQTIPMNKIAVSQSSRMAYI